MTMRMRLAFRHDIGRDFRFIIARVTGAPVHVALLFDDPPHFIDVCIEADIGGVRELNGTTRLARGSWTIVDVPRSIDAAAAHAYACSRLGRGYDWLGVLWAWWFGRPASNGDRGKDFCSELATAALRAGGARLPRPRDAWYTPRRLYEWVTPWRPR